jgi:hypothetical protein
MTLYLVHCGFYDPELFCGVFESHVNIMVAAQDLSEAKAKVREVPEFRRFKMHIDGLQEVKSVSGFGVQWVDQAAETSTQTSIQAHLHRDL